MAQKFQGEYSPQTKDANPRGSFSTRKPSRLRIYRALAIPLGIAGFLSVLGGHPLEAMIKIGGAIGILAACELVREGINAETTYNSRAIARAPGWPRKPMGAILMGGVVGAVSWLGIGTGMPTAIGMGAIAGLGIMMSFGGDPIRGKGLAGVNQGEASRAADAIAKAEAYLREIQAMARSFSDRSLRLDVEQLAISAEEMFHSIENNPGEYRNARRYLSVYLEGARDATSQFLNLPRLQQEADAKIKYKSLIRELDSGFQTKRQLLLEDNRNSLDIEIDVLRDRLASEGISIAKEV